MASIAPDQQVALDKALHDASLENASLKLELLRIAAELRIKIFMHLVSLPPEKYSIIANAAFVPLLARDIVKQFDTGSGLRMADLIAAAEDALIETSVFDVQRIQTVNGAPGDVLLDLVPVQTKLASIRHLRLSLHVPSSANWEINCAPDILSMDEILTAHDLSLPNLDSLQVTLNLPSIRRPGTLQILEVVTLQISSFCQTLKEQEYEQKGLWVRSRDDSMLWECKYPLFFCRQKLIMYTQCGKTTTAIFKSPDVKEA
jgi:hypothetical protein